MKQRKVKHSQLLFKVPFRKQVKISNEDRKSKCIKMKWSSGKKMKIFWITIQKSCSLQSQC